MEKFKFIFGQFVGWLITTPQGALVLSSVWGVVLTRLAYITPTFLQFEPFSYGVLFFCVFFTSFILTMIVGWIWTHVSDRIGTRQPTFVKYRIDNWRLSLVSKSNIYRLPHIKQLDQTVTDMQPAQQATPTRQQRRNAQRTATQLIPTGEQRRSVAAMFIVHFEKPIRRNDFHLIVDHEGGSPPTVGDTAIDERWGSVVLSDMLDGTTFTIRFNDAQ